MKFSVFLEGKKTIKFYHGSEHNLPVGTILTSHIDHEKNWGINEWYHVLKDNKPQNMISRTNAVFLVDNLDDVDLAGGSDHYIYEVLPIGTTEKHDINWISELEMLLEDEFENNQQQIIQAAKNYWNGVAHYNESVWEYLTLKAKIIKLIETN